LKESRTPTNPRAKSLLIGSATKIKVTYLLERLQNLCSVQ